ncbi:MAG TPA: hypothetical protein DIS79_08320, partial [Bacteroidetes bacterium]|nr:hypothetical protein [Bacteroidota bacterium]
MKTHITIAILLLATTRLVAQNVDAEQLDLTSLGFTVSGSDSVLALDDDHVPWGWNWLSADGDISRTMGMNLHHTHDPFAWRFSADSNFRFTRVPGQRLASTVNGISVTSELGRSQFMVPAEAISLEWSPWLIPSGDTMALNLADSLGSVFGFRYRDYRGNVRIMGHDLSLRYNLDTSQFTGPTLVLHDTEFGESLSRWRPSDVNITNDNLGYNTDTLWLAVHVRRASNDTDSAHQLDDPVLRIRVPYWLASDCQDANGDSSHARFRWIPVDEDGEEEVTSTLGRVMGRRWRVDTTNTAPTEIVITRRMLPAYSSNNGDITIYAVMFFNYDFGNAAQDKSWNNPYVNTHFEFNTTKVKRLSVDVVFEDNLDVDIKWIRLESSEARHLFWGQEDLAIRNAVSTFMANLRRYNRDSVAVPGEQPRLWRIYGRDEIRLMHWKGFRYINRMLHDYVTTEWEVSHYSRALHCLRLREYWQGQGGAIQWHDNIASPTFRHGVTQWRDIADSANMYLGLGKGRLDQPDFETHTYYYKDSNSCGNRINLQRRSTLPIHADSLHLYTTGYSGGVQTRVDHMLYDYMFRERTMLFSPGRKWLSNVWTYAAVNAYPENNSEGRRLRFTSNGRPKSAEEMRLQMWLPLVLGAKGLVFYCGTSDTLRTNASFWQDPDDPMTADIGCAAHIASAFTISATGLARILTDSMGTDYLQSNEHGNLDDYVTNGLATTSMAFHANASGDPGIYVGRKAMRQVMLEVLHGITPYSNVLNDLQLVGWR